MVAQQPRAKKSDWNRAELLRSPIGNRYPRTKPRILARRGNDPSDDFIYDVVPRSSVGGRKILPRALCRSGRFHRVALDRRFYRDKIASNRARVCVRFTAGNSFQGRVTCEIRAILSSGKNPCDVRSVKVQEALRDVFNGIVVDVFAVSGFYREYFE